MHWLVHLPSRIAAGEAPVVLVPRENVQNPKPWIFRGLMRVRLDQEEGC